MVVYLLFSRYISCSNFWHVSPIHVFAIDFRRGRAHSTVRSRALHTVCGVSIECLEWIVLFLAGDFNFMAPSSEFKTTTMSKVICCFSTNRPTSTKINIKCVVQFSSMW